MQAKKNLYIKSSVCARSSLQGGPTTFVLRGKVLIRSEVEMGHELCQKTLTILHGVWPCLTPDGHGFKDMTQVSDTNNWWWLTEPSRIKIRMDSAIDPIKIVY